MLPRIALVLLLLTPIAAAGDDVLAALGSADFATRQQATMALMADESLTLEQVVELYGQAATDEQRQRLLNVAYHHAMRAVRLTVSQRGGDGAMGITQKGYGAEHLPEIGQPAVLVVTTFPGFPGHAHLQEGDLILAVNDRAFPQHLPSINVSQEFGRMVREVRAGEPLSLTVRRNGQVLTVRMHLASLDALNALYGRHRPFDAQHLERWREIRRQMLADEQPTDPIVIERAATEAVGLNVE